MKPFADDARQITIGDLVFENGTDRISLHGEIEFARDRHGLEAALELARIAGDIATALKAMPDLPEEAAAPERSTRTFDNPFEGGATS